MPVLPLVGSIIVCPGFRRPSASACWIICRIMTKGYVKSVTELIGQSPVVKLKRMVPEGAADVS
jgi:hypothetical protein